VVIGAARDIVEECGVPRFLFSDFPLGNPCGKPGDLDMQRRIVGYALELLESAMLPDRRATRPRAGPAPADEENDAHRGRSGKQRHGLPRRGGFHQRTQVLWRHAPSSWTRMYRPAARIMQ
jgi:hypothetical protein